jgi:hypothetical protein
MSTTVNRGVTPHPERTRQTRTGISGFVTQHPVPIFYALAFAISWGGFSSFVVPMACSASVVVTGIVVGLVVGFLEELGWTGFALPRLRRRYGVVTTGLVIGLACCGARGISRCSRGPRIRQARCRAGRRVGLTLSADHQG